MRRLFLPLAILISCASTFAQNKPILVNANYQSISLADLFSRWNKEYGVKISYSVDITSNIHVTTQLKDSPIEEALQEITRSAGLTYQVIDNNYLIIPPSSQSVPERYHFNIKGKVTDEHNGETLPHATIALLGTNQHTITDNDGRFTLTDVTNDTLVIEVSYLGFAKKRIRLTTIKHLENLTITLKNASYNMDEVVIVGDRVAEIEASNVPGKFGMNPQIRNRLPSLGDPDVFRTIQLLPGISGTNGSSSELSIRGSMPSQNLVLLDGYTLYHLDHFYGVYSAVNSDYVKDVQVFRNPVLAKYGGRVSGVVDLIGKTGNQNQVSGSLGLNMLSAKSSIEVPISKKLTFVGFARRSHTDIVQSQTFQKIFEIVRKNNDNIRRDDYSPEVETLIPDFYFYDVNGKLTFRPTSNDRLSFSWFKSQDILRNQLEESFDDPDFSFSSELEENNEWGNHGLSVQYSHNWSDKTSSHFKFTTSNYTNDYSFEQNWQEFYGEDETIIASGYSFNQDNMIEDLGIEYTHQINLNNQVNLELGIGHHTYSIDFIRRYYDFEIAEQNNDFEAVTNGFIHSSIKKGKHQFESGLRIDYSQKVGQLYAEPRVAYSFGFSEHLKLRSTFSTNYQFVKQVEFFDPVVGNQKYWLAANGEDLEVTGAQQLSLGLNYKKNGWTIDLEGYHKSLTGISEFFQPELFSAFYNRGEGEIFNGNSKINGLDLLVQREYGNYTGWVSYSLMQANQQFDEINDNDYFPSMQDQRHEIKWVNTLRVGRMSFALNWIYGSGRYFPFYQVNLVSEDIFTGDLDILLQRVYDQSVRLPDFHRMDLTIARNWSMKKLKGEYGLSIFNLYNRRNIKSRRIDIDKVEEYYYGFTNEYNPYIDLKLLDFTPSVFLNIRFN